MRKNKGFAHGFMQPVQNSYLRVRKSCANIYVCASYMQPTLIIHHYFYTKALIIVTIYKVLHTPVIYITDQTFRTCSSKDPRQTASPTRVHSSRAPNRCARSQRHTRSLGQRHHVTVAHNTAHKYNTYKRTIVTIAYTGIK